MPEAKKWPRIAYSVTKALFSKRVSWTILLRIETVFQIRPLTVRQVLKPIRTISQSTKFRPILRAMKAILGCN